MRRVSVMGTIHDIPDDREWIIQAMEMERSDRRTSYQYRFPASPGTAVHVQKCTEDLLLGYGQDQELPHPQEWEVLPPKHIHEFLVGGLDVGSTKTGRQSASFDINVNMGEAERRFLERVGEPKNKKKKNKKTLPKTWNTLKDDPIKAAYSAPPISFEQELLAPPPGFKSHYPKGGKPMEEDMSDGPQFQAGTRVIFQDPQTGDPDYGTVVGRVPEMRGKSKPGQYLVASDRSSNYNSTHIKYTGRNHGIVVDTKKSSMIKATEGNWHGVPDHIGVFVSREFIQDDVKFCEYVTGRILTDIHQGMVDVSWNFSNDNFHSIEDEAGAERHNVWSVPAGKLNMCTFDRHTKNVLRAWPSSTLGQDKERKTGDLCTVRGRSVTVLNSDDQEVVLQSGTVVELLNNKGGRYRIWNCQVIGECADNLLNKTVQIRGDYLKEHPSPDNFYRPGQEVEIVAVVDFRKKPLQGMKGRVILSTDREGDVGIEFKEDIGAGSLDGIGREGHCIYIEASLVKSSE